LRKELHSSLDRTDKQDMSLEVMLNTKVINCFEYTDYQLFIKILIDFFIGERENVVFFFLGIIDNYVRHQSNSVFQLLFTFHEKI
jgi:hypothetical protein